MVTFSPGVRHFSIVCVCGIFDVPGNLAPAFAASAPAGGVLGCFTRGPIRVRADAYSSLSAGKRARRVVSGCGATEKEKGRRV